MPKVSAEERRRRRLEKKKKQLEEKKQAKRDHLEREVKYGALTVKQYEKDWRRMLVKVTLPKMRQDLEYAWHNFERVIDCKDFTVSLLMDELRDAEEQYMRNFSHHSDNMDLLVELFERRTDELKKDYDEEVRKMEERCTNEVEVIRETADDSFNYLKTMLYKLELEKREQMRTKRAEYYSRLDEVEVKNQLLLQKLKAHLEVRYQNIFADMKRFVQVYNRQIRDRKREHRKLKDADDSIQQLIAYQFRHIKKLQDVIRLLKQKHNDAKQTEGSRLLDLKAERQYFANSLLTLKRKLETDKQDDFKKMKCLSQTSAGTFACLERLNRKGETILKMATVCRKLETQKEKILAFPLSTNGIQQVGKRGDDDDDNKAVTKEMELFWQRVGQAYGVHYTLQRERRFLKEENEVFVETHNAYCEKLEYPDRRAVAGGSRTVNKIDANFEMMKYKATIPEIFNDDVLESGR